MLLIKTQGANAFHPPLKVGTPCRDGDGVPVLVIKTQGGELPPHSSGEVLPYGRMENWALSKST